MSDTFFTGYTCAAGGEIMNITILNGSPKGDMSVTMQYARFFREEFPEHRFIQLNIAQKLGKFEKNPEYEQEVYRSISSSDLVLFFYPLYYLTVHSQYMRFFELLEERGSFCHFKGKYAASLSTSIHFYDHTARNFIRSFCDAAEMRYIDGITAKMDDIFDKKVRSSIREIGASWLQAVEQGISGQNLHTPIETDTHVAIVMDGSASDEGSLHEVAALLQQKLPKVRIVYLRDLKFGPCLGCLHCGFDNICVYEGKDDFNTIYRNIITPAEILFFLLPLSQRFFSSVFQRYLERTFVRNHQPTYAGKQLAFVFDGVLANHALAREVITGYSETMGAASTVLIDTRSDPQELTSLLIYTVEKLLRFHQQGTEAPKSFLGIAGMKVFRDDIYSHLRFVFQEDHRRYRQLGLYDFPHKKRLLRLKTSLAVLAAKVPILRSQVQARLKSGMVAPYEKLFRRLAKERAGSRGARRG